MKGDVETEDALNGLTDNLATSIRFHFHIEDIESPKADTIYQMQEGLLKVRTKYVLFFGSDDFMLPSMLSTQIQIAKMIEEHMPGKIPIVNPSLLMTDEDLNPTQYLGMKKVTTKGMLKSCMITEAALTEAQALRNVGGFYDPTGPDWGYVNTYAMWLRLLFKYECEVYSINSPMALYRQLESSRHKTRYQTKEDYRKHHERLKEIARYYFPKGARSR